MLTITPAIQQRIEEQERGRHARLLNRAKAMNLITSPDYCTPNGCLVWEPTIQGRCNVVTAEACTCREFAIHGDCPHHALMIEMTGAQY